MAHRSADSYYMAFTEKVCQSLNIDRHLESLIMQLWNQAFAYSIFSCINNASNHGIISTCILYSMSNMFTFNCLFLHLCRSGIYQTFHEFKVLLFFFGRGVTEISKFPWWLKTWIFGTNKLWFKTKCVTC